MKRIGIYYRVSTDKQELVSQQLAIENWLDSLPENKRPAHRETYCDEGKSGKSINRPGLKKLLDRAYKGHLDTIVVFRLDRFSRDANIALRLILDLDAAGVAFVAVSQPILNLGHENPFRRTMLAAFAEIAQMERDSIVSRVKAGLQAAKKQGKVLGPPKKITSKSAIEARDLRKQGLSIRKIAAHLDLSVGSIHRLLNDRID